MLDIRLSLSTASPTPVNSHLYPPSRVRNFSMTIYFFSKFKPINNIRRHSEQYVLNYIRIISILSKKKKKLIQLTFYMNNISIVSIFWGTRWNGWDGWGMPNVYCCASIKYRIRRHTRRSCILFTYTYEIRNLCRIFFLWLFFFLRRICSPRGLVDNLYRTAVIL